jgi:N-acetylneuraminic acid mutarotase
VVGAAEQEAPELDVGVLRWLKREFGFYSIELFAEQQEIAFTAGGADSSMRSLNTVERYNVTDGVWREGASLGCARQNFSLCDLGGELYAIGGEDEHNYLASVERYDPSVDSWSASPPMPRARDGHCAVAVDDAIFVIGGVESLGNMQNCVSSVLKFCSRTQAWSEVAPTPEPRTNAGACVVGSNIYYLGGKGPNNSSTATTYCYKTQEDAWVTLAPVPEAKLYDSVCAVEGLIYVMGGKPSHDIYTSSVHRFDPVTNSWSEMAPMLKARSSFATFVLNGSIHVVGGHTGGRPFETVECYNAASDSWSRVASMGRDRSHLGAHAMQVDLNLFDSLIIKAKSAQR